MAVPGSGTLQLPFWSDAGWSQPEYYETIQTGLRRQPKTNRADHFSNYADFYAKAAHASKMAYNASRAKQEGDFKKFVVELRVACDSCHAVYLKVDR